MERFAKPKAAEAPPVSPTSLGLADGGLRKEDLVFVEEIGRGAYGRVHRGTCRGAPVAIKAIALRALLAQALEKYLFSELAALRANQHPNLIRYLGAAQDGAELFIVTEFMAGGTLRGVLAPGLPPLPWRLRVALARAAAEGLACLHSSELLHRDIKTENLLLDDSWRLVIADYGFAKKVADLKGGSPQPGTILGTEAFMAPEVTFGEGYGEKADVFSLGCVLAELLTGRVPGERGFLERTPRNKFAADLAQLRAAAPPGAPPSLVECTCQCLAYEPEARPSSDDALLWLRDLEAELPPFDPAALPRPSQLQAQRAAAEAAARAGAGAGSAGGAGAGDSPAAAAEQESPEGS